MKAHIRLPRITVEVEGGKMTELFEAASEVSEIFGQRCCGLCGSEDILPHTRKVEGNSFYEMHCQNPSCRARLTFGQIKAQPGKLYPRRKLDANGKPVGPKKDGDYGDNNGWTKYKGEVRDDGEGGDDNVTPPPAPARRPQPPRR